MAAPDLRGPSRHGGRLHGRVHRDGFPCRHAGSVAGGGDPAANAVGVGAIAPGVVALSLGTSGVVFATTETPLRDPAGQVHAFCHAVPGRWHMMTVMLSAAGSLRWFRDALAPGETSGD